MLPVLLLNVIIPVLLLAHTVALPVSLPPTEGVDILITQRVLTLITILPQQHGIEQLYKAVNVHQHLVIQQSLQFIKQ